MQVANDTAAPLAQDLIDSFRSDDSSKGQQHIFQQQNIKVAVVEQTLAWLISSNPSGWDNKTFTQTKKPAFFEESRRQAANLTVCNGWFGYGTWLRGIADVGQMP